MCSDYSGLDSPSHTLPPAPTTTNNNSGTYGISGRYVPVSPTSSHQGMLDRIPSVASTSQYQACMAASLSPSREPPLSGDDDGVAEIE